MWTLCLWSELFQRTLDTSRENGRPSLLNAVVTTSGSTANLVMNSIVNPYAALISYLEIHQGGFETLCLIHEKRVTCTFEDLHPRRPNALLQILIKRHPGELRFDHTSNGARIGSAKHDRIEISADGWNLFIETTARGASLREHTSCSRWVSGAEG